jgi:hypothetical protein
MSSIQIQKTKKNKSLNIMTLKDVGNKLLLINIESIKRWLRNNNVPIHKISKNNIVYQIDVECAIDSIKVKQIRAEYPDDWEERYRIIVKDHAVYQMVIMTLKNDVISRKPTTKVAMKNDEDLKLLKELMK